MTIDFNNLTKTVAKAMESVEQDHDDDDAAIGDVMLVYEVRADDGRRGIRIASSEGMPQHARLGILSEAENLMTMNQMARWMKGSKGAEEGQD